MSPLLIVAQESTEVKPIDSQEEIIEIIDVEEEEEPDEDTVFTFAEVMPEFPGGAEALYLYMAQNIVYPKAALEKGIKGIVFTSFTIDKTGKLKHAQILRGIGYGCDEEALRVVRSMPDWNPGMQRGKAVNVRFTLPLNFTTPK